MRLHIVQHESFEAPGAILVWARERKYPVAYTRLYEGEVLPGDCTGFDFLIIMGGPQSPATTTEECSYFRAKNEEDFIGKTIADGKCVLGVCLGAQLIGEALGAKFAHSPDREIGVFEVSLTDAGKKDPVFSGFPMTFPVGHWHGDMPGLTTEAEVLAYSTGCPRQVVRYTPKVYGFQCHFEFTPESIRGMIKNCSDELERYKHLPYIQQADVLLKQDFTGINRKLFSFLDFMDSGRSPITC